MSGTFAHQAADGAAWPAHTRRPSEMTQGDDILRVGGWRESENYPEPAVFIEGVSPQNTGSLYIHRLDALASSESARRW